MLTKIMKYDFKSIGKGLLPLYILTLMFAMLTRGLTLLGNSIKVFEVFSLFSNVLSLALILALLLMTLLLSVKRFYCHLFKEEGYLTNMLPVKTKSHIISKFLVPACYCLLTVITIMFSLFIVYYDMQLIATVEAIITPIVTLLPLAGASIILSYLSYILLFIASYSVGQLALNSKIMFAIIGGVAIYFVSQIVAVIGLVVLCLINPEFLALLDSGDIGSLSALFILLAALQIINICIYYLITTAALKRKMDLE